jgi:outer membrane protein assembly factor BamB
MSLIHRCQQGFTTVTLMGVLAVGGLLVAAGFATVDPDISLSREDQDYKQAYGAAEAGLQWYLNSLNKDNDYYVKCTAANLGTPQVPALPLINGQPAPVSDAWNGVGADLRRWRNLPGESAQYAVELLPAPGYNACVPGEQYSMVDSNGNLRVRVSGRSRGETRTIVASLRRRNFIDFIYFTDFEALDPEADSSTSTDFTDCARYRNSRAGHGCTEIRFVDDDEVLGPMHTNDNVLICGSPTFGRSEQDAVEINGPAPWVRDCTGATADVEGTLIHPAGQLGMPPSNQGLRALAEDDYLFAGRTTIVLNGTQMQVTNALRGGTFTMPLPDNGVIYVGNVDGGCTDPSFSYRQEYDSPETCGDVWVSGQYGRDLTIAADNDVVVNGSITRVTGNDGLLLGLIANQFVRVYHPVSDNCSSNLTGSLPNLKIQAAILALTHSFLVDNWYCGTSLGNLTVEGAIAQRFRGPVGTTGGTGYFKDYRYNDRLRYREPPFFLDPVQASWRISRQNEQVPAVGAGG